MPSFILIRPTVWPQYTNVTDKRSPKNGQTFLSAVKDHVESEAGSSSTSMIVENRPAGSYDDESKLTDYQVPSSAAKAPR